MATVTLAAIKIGGILLGITPIQTVVIAGVVTVIYSSIGGFKGVVITDFVLFFLSIFGGVAAAYVALKHPSVDGLSNLLSHPNVVDKLSIFPDFDNKELLLTVFVIPIAVQWWSVWYPGAEPGGGGYVAQRMLAAKDEDNAIKSVFFFNFVHYVVRPWPWIIVALCSLIVFPDVASIQSAFPDAQKVGHDMAYPAMLTYLPAGILGLVVVSLIAAYMSTISTHLNWGASYIVHDFYKRFVNPKSEEKELVLLGRITTVLLMFFAGLIALFLTDALKSFQILLQIGAGTGLIFILRWFWWRINAWSEITAMTVSFVIAVYFEFGHEALGFTEIPSYLELILSIIITTIAWVGVALLTSPAKQDVLVNFVKKTNPGGPGWKTVMDKAHAAGEHMTELKNEKWNVPRGILCMFLGCIFTYSSLIGLGYWIYSEHVIAIILTLLAIISAILLRKTWKTMGTE